MGHLVPYLERHVNSSSARAGGEPGGVVEEDLRITDLDEDGRQTAQVG